MKRHPQILNRAHTALLVVDVQTKLTQAVRNGQAMVGEIVKLVRGFRILGLPIFVTEQYPKGLGHTEPGILEALGGNSAVVKATFSCCGAPDLVSNIRSQGIRQILVSGTEAHVCVQQTALDLLSRDFQVQLAVDAVAPARSWTTGRLWTAWPGRGDPDQRRVGLVRAPGSLGHRRVQADRLPHQVGMRSGSADGDERGGTVSLS